MHVRNVSPWAAPGYVRLSTALSRRCESFHLRKTRRLPRHRRAHPHRPCWGSTSPLNLGEPVCPSDLARGASVGPLLVPGRSKNASTSAGRTGVRPRPGDLRQPCADAGGDGVDEGGHGGLLGRAVGVAVGGDHPLVDAPGDLDPTWRSSANRSCRRAFCLSVSRSVPVAISSIIRTNVLVRPPRSPRYSSGSRLPFMYGIPIRPMAFFGPSRPTSCHLNVG